MAYSSKQRNACLSRFVFQVFLGSLILSPLGCSQFRATAPYQSIAEGPGKDQFDPVRHQSFGTIRQASYQHTQVNQSSVPHASIGTPISAESQHPSTPAANLLPLTGQEELSVKVLVQHVLARNPTLAKMAAAYDAVVARYHQVTSYDDPMFGAAIGPASIGSNDVDFAYKLEVSQKIPFPGKLRLRGEKVMAKASAAGNDVDDVRLQLIESAKLAFFEYYLIARSLEVNDESLKLLREFRKIAETQYKTGKAPQQDMLQTDVEIGREQERRLNLEQMKKVAVARLNTLMHLPVDAPLPGPPRTIQPHDLMQNLAALRSAALARRPDLQALANHIVANETALGLAFKDYYPDFEFMAGYNWFWQFEDLRPIVGVRLNLPLQHAKRGGAVQEAQAKIAQLRAELASQSAQVAFEVQEAYEQVIKSEKVVRLYRKTILPSARANVKAAQAAYVTGKVPFLSLIEAQRNLINLRNRSHAAVAEYFSRHARLERVTGGQFEPSRSR